MNGTVYDLTEKIQALSSAQRAEVEDFVDFLRHRAHTRELTRASAAVFERVWNDPENDVYDAL